MIEEEASYVNLPSADNEPAPRECWDKCGNCGSYDVTVYTGGAQCQDCGSEGPFLFSAGMTRQRTHAVG